jgi:hypothetical protein
MSPTKARNGSIETLSEASSIHNSIAAASSPGAFGIANSEHAASTAPAKKYGRRRPKRPQVRSL